MKRFNYTGGKQPESILQGKIIEFLRLREWVVMETHGNKYQSGFPDLYCFHHTFGVRWVEVKRPIGYRFTSAQIHFFPHIQKVWIMTAPTEVEYAKLFSDPNWKKFIRPNQDIAPYSPQQLPLPENIEGKIQKLIVEELENNSYTVMVTFGSVYQKGFPDLLTLRLGVSKWVEVKVSPTRSIFTPNQRKYFPLMDACNIGIWILDKPGQLFRLSDPPNWRKYKENVEWWY